MSVSNEGTRDHRRRIRPVVPAVSERIREFGELRESGLLWLINRSLLHPRGFSLAIAHNLQTGEAIGWQLLGDGTEVRQFGLSDVAETELMRAVERTLREAADDAE